MKKGDPMWADNESVWYDPQLEEDKQRVRRRGPPSAQPNHRTQQPGPEPEKEEVTQKK